MYQISLIYYEYYFFPTVQDHDKLNMRKSAPPPFLACWERCSLVACCECQSLRKLATNFDWRQALALVGCWTSDGWRFLEQT